MQLLLHFKYQPAGKELFCSESALVQMSEELSP